MIYNKLYLEWGVTNIILYNSPTKLYRIYYNGLNKGRVLVSDYQTNIETYTKDLQSTSFCNLNCGFVNEKAWQNDMKSKLLNPIFKLIEHL